MFSKLSFSLLVPLPFITSIPTFHVGYNWAIPKLKLKYTHALSIIRSFLVIIVNIHSNFEDVFFVGEDYIDLTILANDMLACTHPCGCSPKHTSLTRPMGKIWVNLA